MQTARSDSQSNIVSRKRIAKACDQCNGSRSKCDGERPCKRCSECSIQCTYDRESRRQGRVARSKSKRHAVVTLHSSTPGRDGALEGNRRPDTQFSYTSAADDSYPSAARMDGDYFPTIAGSSSAWFSNGAPYNMPNWLDGDWLRSLDAVGDDARGVSAPRSPLNIPSTASKDVVRQMSARPEAGWTPVSNSSIRTKLRYPVLEPLAPFITHVLSPTLACDLLESYLANISDAVFVPSSPLLLSHIFRKQSLLSQTHPRPCTPALLASMLLVSSHTTEYPFFGTSPSARMRLYHQLLQLTLDLLEGPGQKSKDQHTYDRALSTRVYRTSKFPVETPSTLGRKLTRTPRHSRYKLERSHSSGRLKRALPSGRQTT